MKAKDKELKATRRREKSLRKSQETSKEEDSQRIVKKTKKKKREPTWEWSIWGAEILLSDFSSGTRSHNSLATRKRWRGEYHSHLGSKLQPQLRPSYFATWPFPLSNAVPLRKRNRPINSQHRVLHESFKHHVVKPHGTILLAKKIGWIVVTPGVITQYL